jgi:hypothetical protein
MNSKTSLWMAIFSFAVSGATYSAIFLTKCVYYLTDTGQPNVTGFCECANENSGFTNRSKIFGPLSDCKLFKDTHKTISSLVVVCNVKRVKCENRREHN